MAVTALQGKTAVLTGGGTGMGRELMRLLAEGGAHIAACDNNPDSLAEAADLARAAAPNAHISTHQCDVSDAAGVEAFAAEAEAVHNTDHFDLLFNNAGIGGGGSIVLDDQREAWDKTFKVCWDGVLNCTRTFLPTLVRSTGAAIVNTSSINGFWATIGPGRPHTAYCAAKFAVKGFTEALMVDLAENAPHVSAHVVMPGHIGTSIVLNSIATHGIDIPLIRKQMAQAGTPVDQFSDEEIMAFSDARGAQFRDVAPTSAAQAAQIILDGVLAGQWRILVGEDAHVIDTGVRADPTAAYTPEFFDGLLKAGHLGAFTR